MLMDHLIQVKTVTSGVSPEPVFKPVLFNTVTHDLEETLECTLASLQMMKNW